MKARIATVLSLTGVLVAGSAAALVNTQVLQGTPIKSEGGNVTLAVDTTSTGVTTTLAAIDNLPSTTGVTTTVAAASTQAVYQIGDAGFVTLDTAGQVLTIVSAVPNAGWMVTEAESEDAYNIEVKFQSATTEIEFHANLLFGVVGTSVETKSLVQQSDDDDDGTTNGNAGTTYSDDDDDEEDDDEQYEEDEDEDEEDEDEGDDD